MKRYLIIAAVLLALLGFALFVIAEPVGSLHHFTTLTPADADKVNENFEALRSAADHVNSSQVENYTLMPEDISTYFTVLPAWLTAGIISHEMLGPSCAGLGLESRESYDAGAGAIDIYAPPNGMFEIGSDNALRFSDHAAGTGLEGGSVDGDTGEAMPLKLYYDNETIKIGAAGMTVNDVATFTPLPGRSTSVESMAYCATVRDDGITEKKVRDGVLSARKMSANLTGNGLTLTGAGDAKRLIVKANSSQFTFNATPVPSTSYRELLLKPGGLTASLLGKYSVYGHNHNIYDHVAAETLTGWNIADGTVEARDLDPDVLNSIYSYAGTQSSVAMESNYYGNSGGYLPSNHVHTPYGEGDGTRLAAAAIPATGTLQFPSLAGDENAAEYCTIMVQMSIFQMNSNYLAMQVYGDYNSSPGNNYFYNSCGSDNKTIKMQMASGTAMVWVQKAAPVVKYRYIAGDLAGPVIHMSILARFNPSPSVASTPTPIPTTAAPTAVPTVTPASD
jgi:hypothetical protein